MAPIFYRKLVRDKIPSIIAKEGKQAVTRRLESGELEYFLRLKLLEEAYELFKAKDSPEFAKEAADVFEVIQALAGCYNVPLAQIEETRQKRAESRGAFADRLYLHAVYSKDEQIPEHESETGCLLNPFVVSTSSSPALLEVIKQELAESTECQIASAFLTRGMINLLKRPLEEFLARGGSLQLLTSTMNDFNNPEDLLHIQNLHSGLQLKVFYPAIDDRVDRFSQVPPAFHLKCFLFKKADDRNSLIIGSSNMTGGGLRDNEEWNFFSNSEVNLPFNREDDRTIFQVAHENYLKYWHQDAIEISGEFLEYYRNRYEKSRQIRSRLLKELAVERTTMRCPKPRQSQLEALEQLAERRSNGVQRTAVIAATGLGKTHLAAFDFAQSGLKNVLFLVHRENILTSARETFREVLEQPEFGELFTGNISASAKKRIASSEQSVFAMVQTLSRSATLGMFAKDRFEYIVFDEFHHSEASTYKKILEHFECEFFLGLTATPERMDGRDVLRLCDYDIAYEARLFNAIDQRWLAPFQYFAIYDPTDYGKIRWTGVGYDEQQLEKALSSDTRTEIIVGNLLAYLPSSGKIKALAFCSNIGHAQYMTEAFNRSGIDAACLTGDSSEIERVAVIDRLQSENDSLKVICSVDILGEGVDIPAVSHVLLLRPTESPTVILQQLGRGLRLTRDKEYLVVLDFVGNYRNSYVIPMIMTGEYSVSTDRPLRVPPHFRLPVGCSVDADLRVQRIWEEDIKRTFSPRRRDEFLLDAYKRMKEKLGSSPTLLDFLANPEAAHPKDFVKVFNNWLRVKERAEDLSDYEKTLLNSPGEKFLQHLEKELSPSKSYKMVVLKVLLADSQKRTNWPVSWLAEGFKNYYLTHPAQMHDCSLLEGEENPFSVAVSRFARLLRDMPLKHLSNLPEDYFIFDRSNLSFILKPEVVNYWLRPEFRVLIIERVEYALALYFHRKTSLNKQRNAGNAQIIAEVGNLEAEKADQIVLPFFSDLKMAAGALDQMNSSETASESISVRQSGNLSADRHFVVKISGNSMDGGKNPIQDGSLVILEKITPDRGGSTAGKIVAVKYNNEFGDTAYALKKIKKTSDGSYYLVSNNRKYPEVKIDPGKLFPFARFISIVSQ
ncbi:MAG: restriction endonuclease subunit R [Candidatus Riflebacteria bacterium HGW-Riflebacteria-2]|jgi:superfamily II DNA or RNA helicase/predicted house-cleaning noncanonical NTP pyrophosphatase (MazG superfamily)/HKD family nuclease/SOS-response transcriptional repressor LexA|nr:MAG: restriction endonuclease subunit R [Candidatus Riflebacteria bacterium HGW-Riflebacteria-2]